MLVDRDLKKILNQLTTGSPITFAFERSEISMQFLENSSKLSLSSVIYDGGNYIPSSVRRCLSTKHLNHSPLIQTFFTIDEPQYKISINYLGPTHNLNDRYLRDLIQEFGETTEEWRLILDENDRNDLVYVHAKK